VLLSDLAKHAAATKSALQALAETLKSCEVDRNRAIHERLQMKRQLKRSLEANAQLEYDREILTSEINELRDEIALCRSRADKVLQSARVRHLQEWTRRENEYKEIIRGLEAQVRKAASSNVPRNKYVSVLKASEDIMAEKEALRREVAGLNSKVTDLQNELAQKTKNQQHFSAPPPPPPPRVLPPPAMAPHRQPAAKRNEHHSATVKPPPATRAHPPPPPVEKARRNEQIKFHRPSGSSAENKKIDRVALRISAARHAGGRKALEQKLKLARSPRARPLQDHNVRRGSIIA